MFLKHNYDVMINTNVLKSVGSPLELKTSQRDWEIWMTRTQASGSILLKNKTKQNFAMKFPRIHNPFQIFIVAFFSDRYIRTPLHVFT